MAMYAKHLQRLSTDPSQTLIYDDSTNSSTGRCVKDVYRSAIEGDVECLKTNLELGVNINALGQPIKKWGPQFDKSVGYAATALHYAASYGRLEAVEFLLQNGADPRVKSTSGHTPKDYAKVRYYTDVLRLIEMYDVRAPVVSDM
eukprot:PhF_6_TR41997/c0_g1_i1/m.63511